MQKTTTRSEWWKITMAIIITGKSKKNSSIYLPPASYNNKFINLFNTLIVILLYKPTHTYSFLASVPILCPLKTFQGYRTRPLTWNELISFSFLTYISNFFLPNVPFWSPWKYQKPNIFYTLLRTRKCAYQGVKNLRFFDVSTGIKREHWEDKS